MLNKLIRHEWKNTWKIPCIIFGVFLALSAACFAYFGLRPNAPEGVEINMGEMLIFIGYMLAVSAFSIFIQIYFAIRFYKNLYTDEGYLMHTLPVKPWMLIASKTVVATFWYYLTSILTTALCFPVIFLSLPKMVYLSPEGLRQYHSFLSDIPGVILAEPLKVFFVAVPFSLLSSAFSVLLIYAAASLGQLFSRHRVLASIMCYFGLNALVSTVSMLVMLPSMGGLVITHADDLAQNPAALFPPAMWTAFGSALVVSIICGAASFFLSDYIMRHSLNLD